MAIVNCKECGTSVSDKAKVCPSCGIKDPSPKRKTSAFTWLVVAILVYALYSAGKSDSYQVDANKQRQSQASKAPLPKLTVEQETATLLAELKTIPVKNHEGNLTRYQRLVVLHPANELYKSKVKFYSDKIARVERIHDQFSGWDGSHIAVTRLIKQRLNDPKSYDHVETRFGADGDTLSVVTTFRAKNKFGGLVLNQAFATVSISSGNVLTLIIE